MRIETDAQDGGLKVLLNVSLHGEEWVLIARFAWESEAPTDRARALQHALVSAMEAEVIAYKEAVRNFQTSKSPNADKRSERRR